MRSLLAALGIVGGALAGCRGRAPDPASPEVAVPSDAASRAADSTSAGSASEDTVPAASLAKATTFVPEKVTGEAHAMGTHLAYAAFTTPALDATHARSSSTPRLPRSSASRS